MPPAIAPVIARFAALYPEVSVDIVATGRMADLVEEGFDVPRPLSHCTVFKRNSYPFQIKMT
jgi:hypothetical protein